MSQDERSAGEQPEEYPAPHLKGREAFKTHLMLVICLALCAIAFWFELGRALRGNHLSWAYVFEWPLLAGFVTYMWWKFLHPVSRTSERRPQKKPVAPEYAGMLAAWEEQQRKLEETRRLDEEAASRNDSAAIERMTDQ
ncbi:MAG TPA: hypothetical protein VII65_03110 [Acidimicrobiales bacterium]